MPTASVLFLALLTSQTGYNFSASGKLTANDAGVFQGILNVSIMPVMADAGLPPTDSGAANGGTDSGLPSDSGLLPDAGKLDSGSQSDTGPTDSGTGQFDSGLPDAGSSDAGSGSGPGQAFDNCPTNAAILFAPIVVNDSTSAVSRYPTRTAFVLPVSQATNLLSVNGLQVKDNLGNLLPAQFETLSRWNGARDDCTKPVRYVYAFVSAMPPAGSSTIWSVINSSQPATLPPPTFPSISIQTTSAAYIVTTGTAQFTVNRTPFNGLSQVLLGSVNGGYTLVSQLAAGQSSFNLVHNGAKTPIMLPPWRLDVERSGPVEAVIVARGFYADATGARDLAYTIRMYFNAGSSVVRVDHTYYYGQVGGWGATNLTTTTLIDRAYMTVPLSAKANLVQVRGSVNGLITSLSPVQQTSIEQVKRTPSNLQAGYRILNGTSSVVETGTWAEHPYLAVQTPNVTVIGTIARMSERDPQGLSYDPTANALNVNFTSSQIQVGSARGIWSTAAIDFRPGNFTGIAAEASSVQQYVERPLLGTPALVYTNSTQTVGPYATVTTGPFARFFTLAASFHRNTRSYMRQYQITGLQKWPDMPRSSCLADFNCATIANQLFDGGDNNYWNWSKVGMDEFFRTGSNEQAWDFSIYEALTMLETISVRTDHDQLATSSVEGLAPCYGSSRGYNNTYVEGLNQRKDSCPADYTYDKTLKLAYLATADQRFVDYFEEAGQAQVTSFGSPPVANPQPYLELGTFRLSEQRLEVLTDGAEFARDRTVGDSLRGNLRSYVDYMIGRTMIGGHICSTQGSGQNSALVLGRCDSNQAWMMPVPIEWGLRTGRFLDHSVLLAYLASYAQKAAQEHTVLTAAGTPDYTQLNASSSTNALNGWRTEYHCAATSAGVTESTCRKDTSIENNGLFYGDGVIAFMNIFGLVLASNPADPAKICTWLPQEYPLALNGLTNDFLNGNVWGKIPGQAFGMSEETIGSIQAYCSTGTAGTPGVGAVLAFVAGVAGLSGAVYFMTKKGQTSDPGSPPAVQANASSETGAGTDTIA